MQRSHDVHELVRVGLAGVLVLALTFCLRPEWHSPVGRVNHQRRLTRGDDLPVRVGPDGLVVAADRGAGARCGCGLGAIRRLLLEAC